VVVAMALAGERGLCQNKKKAGNYVVNDPVFQDLHALSLGQILDFL